MLQSAQKFAGRVRRKIGRIPGDVASAIWKLPTVSLDEIAPSDEADLPPIMDDICLPPYKAPDDHDDYQPLMRITRHLQPRIVVELGTAHGNTVANICRQSAGTRVYTVNALPEAQTGTLDTFKVDRDDIGRVYRDHGFESRVVQIFENTLTLDLSKYLSSPSIDLGIIDACHDKEYVVNDFLKVKPFMSPRGIILLHDTHPSMRGHLRGSYLGCVALRQQGYNIRHIANTWWGVWVNE